VPFIRLVIHSFIHSFLQLGVSRSEYFPSIRTVPTRLASECLGHSMGRADAALQRKEEEEEEEEEEERRR
jgi:hypothetical protein